MAQQKSAQKQTPETRPLDPGMLQSRASDPAHSAWVGASAGTGKTKVLTDRILRLLLPRANRQNGTQPHKILALTFTKAAASEMALRLSETLGRWAVAEEADLRASLAKLLGRTPATEDLTAARRLFAEVIDAPSGLQIMTLHAFCQSVLGRFPLEAGVPPHFTALEDADSALLLSRARDSVFKQAKNEKTSPLSTALRRIAAAVDENAFFKLIRGMARERGQFETLLARHFGAEGLAGVIYDSLSLPRGLTTADIVQEFCNAAPEAALRQAAAALMEGAGKDEPFYGRVIQDLIDSPAANRIENFETYRSVFVTNAGTARERGFPTSATAKIFPALPDILRRESERVIAAIERINAATCAALTGDLLRLGETILANYARLKQERAALDFDDLILLTRTLVQRDGMTRWVQYKLDQGLDHILIDEAQDTNPEQWDIIDALCAAFFEGEGAKDEARTVFTVGDEKQSIYSFQRASPKEFDRMRAHFRQKAKDAQQGWEDVDLHISFRSTESVLRAVDAVFATPGMRAGLGLKDIRHESFRRGQAGLVELWPLCKTPDKQDIDYWQPPVEIEEDTAASQTLASDIAERIESWIGREYLPSRNRKVEAGDILILVRTRTAFVTQLARALKDLGAPVSGMDRMRLNDQIAVQDLLAFAEFALMPGDDLTLATILKSPLIGMDESTLYNLAIDRKASLWAEVQNKAPAITAYLRDVINTARQSRPFGFFSHLLQEPCPADRISGLRAMRSRLGLDCTDPLDELMNAALRFEKDHIASLQLFLHWQKSNDADIKREMEERGSEVRIMTVHGAKGLQAPIVILPDTIRSTRAAPTQADARLLWPDKTDLAVPLWSPRKVMDPALYMQAQETLHEREDEEYRRLLYVALTRAEDRLYIGGYTTRKNAREDSWYFAVKDGLARIEHMKELEDGTLHLTNPQTRDADKAEPKNQDQRGQSPTPAWLFEPAPPEESPPRPLLPSRPAETEGPASSPLDKADNYRFRRGNLTHKLLQFLPDLPEQNRQRAAEHFVAQNAHDLSKEICAEIVKETLAVLNHREFAPVFGPGSRAEVPVTGLVEGNQVVSGQIDRLLITDSAVYIIDFKTNRPPPQKAENVPAIYRRQMQTYADIMRRIYPNRAVHCALLWTDGPFLLPLP